MKRLFLHITALFITICFTSPLPVHAVDNNTSVLTATLSEILVLDTIKDCKPLSKGEKYLSLKVKLAYKSKTMVTFPLNAITLKTQKGKSCELIGIGNGTNDFSQFNVYLPFSAPWYPFSMTYQGDDEKKLFGMKQTDKNSLPEISLLAADQVMLLGFAIPADMTTFTMKIGPAKAIKVNTKASK